MDPARSGIAVTADGQNAFVTTPMRAQGLEACWTYGSAALAVMELRRDMPDAGRMSVPLMAAYADVVEAHETLRERFADGAVEGIAELALTVLVLAERTRMLLA